MIKELETQLKGYKKPSPVELTDSDHEVLKKMFDADERSFDTLFKFMLHDDTVKGARMMYDIESIDTYDVDALQLEVNTMQRTTQVIRRKLERLRNKFILDTEEAIEEENEKKEVVDKDENTSGVGENL